MLMRFEPFRDFDRITEELLSERRARQIPVDAYRRGNDSKFISTCPAWIPGSSSSPSSRISSPCEPTRAWVRTEGDQVQIAERPHGEFSRQLFLGESLDRDHITPTTRTVCSPSPSPSLRRPRTRNQRPAGAGPNASSPPPTWNLILLKDDPGGTPKRCRHPRK